MTQARRKPKADPGRRDSSAVRPKAHAGRTGKPKPYHHGDLRQVLVDGALALIDEEGIAALSLREVARRIGVSHAAPYHHFVDRAALLAAVAEQGFLAMRQGMITAMRAADPGALDRLRAVGVAYIRFAADNPAQFRVMFSPDIVGEKSSLALKAASQATFAELTDGLLAAGLSKDTAQHVALLAWSSVHGASMLWIDRQLSFPEGPMASEGTPNVDAFAQMLVGLLTKSLESAKAGSEAKRIG